MHFKKTTLCLCITAALSLQGCNQPSEKPEPVDASTNSQSPKSTEASRTEEIKPDAEVIALSFGWPPELRASVNFVREKQESSSGFNHEQIIRGSYDLATQLEAQGLLINRYNYSIEIDNLGGSKDLNPVDQQAQDFLVKTSSKTPLYVVGELGNLAGFFDLEEFKQELRASAEEWAKHVQGPARESVPTVIENLTAGNNIESSLIAVWDREVALWSGQSLMTGKSYTTEGTQAFASLDFVRAPVLLTLKLHGRVACTDADKQNQCVELEYSYTLDQSKFDQLENAYLSARDDGRKQLKSANMSYELRIITEPNTLLPHKLIETETLSHVIVREGFNDISYSKEIQNTTNILYRFRPDLLLKSGNNGNTSTD